MAAEIRVQSRVEGAYRVPIKDGRLYVVEVPRQDAEHLDALGDWLKKRFPNAHFIMSAGELDARELEPDERAALRQVLDEQDARDA